LFYLQCVIMSMSINSSTNTKFADVGELPAHIVSPISTSVVMNNAKALEAATTDEQWAVKQMLAKPVSMDTIAWKTADTVGSALRSYNMPYEILLANKHAPGFTVLSAYTFFSCKYAFQVSC